MTLIYFVSNYPTKAVICEITNSPSCTGSSSCSTLVGALAGSVAGSVSDVAAMKSQFWHPAWAYFVLSMLLNLITSSLAT